MKTLVTGSTGLLGNNVVRLFLERGDDVRVLIRPSSDMRALEGLPVEIRRGDVRSADDVRRAVEGVERIVHSAAHVHIGWSGRKLARAINVEGTQHVCQAARAAGVRMVHVSSVDTLGLGRGQEPADEETPLVDKVPCPYVLTKREAERLVQQEVERGLGAVIVNPGYMLGPWDWKPSSGRMLLQVARHQPLAAPTGGLSLCDARDVAAGVWSALDRGEIGRRYVLAGVNLSYRQAWRLFARVAKSRPPIFFMGPLVRVLAGAFGDLWSRLVGTEAEINSAAIRMSKLRNFYCSHRAERELGYQMRPVEQTVADAWNWFQEHGYTRRARRQRPA